MKPSASRRAYLQRGGANVWLPYATLEHAPTPLAVRTAEGSRIYLEDGRTLVDGLASWWTACHGYSPSRIVHAVQAQLERLPHIMFAGLTHEPALRLARRLAALTPGDLTHVFFSESGSVAIEVALKIAVQYAQLQGQTRRVRFLCFKGGYHGDTRACMALSDPASGFQGLLTPYAHPMAVQATLPRDSATTHALDQTLARHRDTLAGVVIEPLIQGAGGMLFHDPATLRRVADLCHRHNILLIADEIFTGFGRTGTLFACEQAGIVPELLCLGKGLTGGVLPLAATVARAPIFAAFENGGPEAALMHGPTFMANPLACAAANASLDLFERTPRLKQARRLESWLREDLAPCQALPGVQDVRVKGAVGVVELRPPLDLGGLRAALVEKGVWIRPFGRILYLTPALTIARNDVRMLTRAIHKVIAKLHPPRGPQKPASKNVHPHCKRERSRIPCPVKLPPPKLKSAPSPRQ